MQNLGFLRLGLPDRCSEPIRAQNRGFPALGASSPSTDDAQLKEESHLPASPTMIRPFLLAACCHLPRISPGPASRRIPQRKPRHSPGHAGGGGTPPSVCSGARVRLCPRDGTPPAVCIGSPCWASVAFKSSFDSSSFRGKVPTKWPRPPRAVACSASSRHHTRDPCSAAAHST